MSDFLQEDEARSEEGMLLELDDTALKSHILEHTDLLQKYREEQSTSLSDAELLCCDNFQNFAADWIKNEAHDVVSFDRVVDYYGEEESFSHTIMEYQGIYFYESIDCEDEGY